MDLLPPQSQSPTPLIAAKPEVVGPQQTSFDIWGLLSRRKWIIVIMGLIGLGAGFLYYYQADRIYQSEAKISIEPKNKIALKTTNSDDLQSVIEASRTSHDQMIDSQVFLQKVMNSNTGNQSLFELETFQNMNSEDAVAFVEQKLEVDPDIQNLDIYYLSFTSGSANDCQIILRNIIDKYKQELADRYSLNTNQLVNTFEKIESSLIGELNRLNDRLQQERARYDTPLVGRENQTLATQDLITVSRLLAERENDLVRLMNKREQIRKMEELAEESGEFNANDIVFWILVRDNELGEMGADKQIEYNLTRTWLDIKKRYDEAVMQREILKDRYGKSHPNMQALEQTIVYLGNMLNEDSIRGEFNAEMTEEFVPPEEQVKRYKFELELEIEGVQKEVQALAQQKEELTQRTLALERIMDRIKDTQKQIDDVDYFLRQAKEVIKSAELADVDEGKGYFFSELTEPRQSRVVWPNLPLVLSLGSILGSLLGFGLAYLVDVSDKTFRSPEEIIRQLSLPLVGHIPVITSSKRFKLEDSLIDPLICSYHRPKSHSAEAFRAIRTALYFNVQGKSHSVIQISSPTPGDGKSTIAANLAVSIAQSGKRVLLVDGDMRRPMIHHTFGIKSDEGFATVLAGQTQWEKCVFECEEVDGLSIMPCGPKPSNPAELITSPRVKQLINEMRQKFDFVLIDTPPILAVTDPCPVAARVDGVILTIRIKKNVKISADRATKILQGVGANIVGVVVNGVGVQTGYGSQYSYGAYRAGYSYNGYGYGYGYGYGGRQYYEDENAGPQRRSHAYIEGPDASNRSTRVGANRND